MHLTLIETSSNQRYIFATNKLRENVGASELTYRVGTEFVLAAVQKITGVPLPAADRRAVLRRELNPRIEDGGAVEIVMATSGKALLLTRDGDTARRIVRDVTLTALETAPGLDVAGVVGAAFEWTRDSLDEQVGRVHALFEQQRARRPSPAMRFHRLPIVAPCATSGLPAAAYDAGGPEPGLRSAVARAKRENAKPGIERIAELLPERLARSIEELERRFEGLDWLGVVHADGNGVGEILLKFGQHVGARDARGNRRYADALREFSVRLDECCLEAFRYALRVLPAQPARRRPLFPAVPLVLGGDDLTLVCDGRWALPFGRAFLCAFERETAKRAAVRDVARAAFGRDGLSACAGVAIVKPHFPFHLAYELAEELLQSAKGVKTHVKRGDKPWAVASALDFHVLFDASGSRLADVRAGLTPGGASLLARPYVITAPDELGDAEGRDWCERHHWSRLEQRVAALLRPSDEDAARPALPRSQTHWLREGLFLGREEADARLGLIRSRYAKDLAPFVEECEGTPSLFWTEGKTCETGLLDAMEASEFLGEGESA
jgi:hypothetical protein